MKKVLILGLIIFGLFLIGCQQSTDFKKFIDKSDYIGKKVDITGTAKLNYPDGCRAEYGMVWQGFIDKNGNIIYYSTNKQKDFIDGREYTISGILKKSPYNCFYLDDVQ